MSCAACALLSYCASVISAELSLLNFKIAAVKAYIEIEQ